MTQPIQGYMGKSGITVDQLAEAAAIDPKTVKAIATGNYIPSPAQRQRLAAALGVSKDEIAWGHTVPVQQMRGNGPQWGRST